MYSPSSRPSPSGPPIWLQAFETAPNFPSLNDIASSTFMTCARLSGILEKSSAWPISIQFSSFAMMIYAPNRFSLCAGLPFRRKQAATTRRSSPISFGRKSEKGVGVMPETRCRRIGLAAHSRRRKGSAARSPPASPLCGAMACAVRPRLCPAATGRRPHQPDLAWFTRRVYDPALGKWRAAQRANRRPHARVARARRDGGRSVAFAKRPHRRAGAPMVGRMPRPTKSRCAGFGRKLAL